VILKGCSCEGRGEAGTISGDPTRGGDSGETNVGLKLRPARDTGDLSTDFEPGALFARISVSLWYELEHGVTFCDDEFSNSGRWWVRVGGATNLGALVFTLVRPDREGVPGERGATGVFGPAPGGAGS
jgi:hypothetical protein